MLLILRSPRRRPTTPKTICSSCLRSLFTRSAASSDVLRHLQLRPETLFIIRSTSTNPFFNLSLEDYILRHSTKTSKVLFTYSNRKSVVIGRNQNLWSEINLPLLKSLSEKGDDKEVLFVRRLSGGGAVYHDLGNLCWSLTTPRDIFDRDAGAHMVVSALEKCGVSARVNERHDIVIPKIMDDGSMKEFKVSGSAYKLKARRAYHHATLLLNTDLRSLSGILHSPLDPYIVGKGVKSVKSAVENLVDVDKAEFVERLEVEFVSRHLPKKSGGDDIVRVEASEEELLPELEILNDTITELQSQKFQVDQTPKFLFEIPAKTMLPRLPDLPWDFRGIMPEFAEFKVFVENGRIVDSSISLDSDPEWALVQVHESFKHLRGCEFDGAAMVEKLDMANSMRRGGDAYYDLCMWLANAVVSPHSHGEEKERKGMNMLERAKERSRNRAKFVDRRPRGLYPLTKEAANAAVLAGRGGNGVRGFHTSAFARKEPEPKSWSNASAMQGMENGLIQRPSFLTRAAPSPVVGNTKQRKFIPPSTKDAIERGELKQTEGFRPELAKRRRELAQQKAIGKVLEEEEEEDPAQIEKMLRGMDKGSLVKELAKYMSRQAPEKKKGGSVIKESREETAFWPEEENVEEKFQERFEEEGITTAAINGVEVFEDPESYEEPDKEKEVLNWALDAAGVSTNKKKNKKSKKKDHHPAKEWTREEMEREYEDTPGWLKKHIVDPGVQVKQSGEDEDPFAGLVEESKRKKKKGRNAQPKSDAKQLVREEEDEDPFAGLIVEDSRRGKKKKKQGKATQYPDASRVIEGETGHTKEEKTEEQKMPAQEIKEPEPVTRAQGTPSWLAQMVAKQKDENEKALKTLEQFDKEKHSREVDNKEKWDPKFFQQGEEPEQVKILRLVKELEGGESSKTSEVGQWGIPPEEKHEEETLETTEEAGQCEKSITSEVGRPEISEASEETGPEITFQVPVLRSKFIPRNLKDEKSTLKTAAMHPNVPKHLRWRCSLVDSLSNQEIGDLVALVEPLVRQYPPGPTWRADHERYLNQQMISDGAEDPEIPRALREDCQTYKSNVVNKKTPQNTEELVEKLKELRMQGYCGPFKDSSMLLMWVEEKYPGPYTEKSKEGKKAIDRETRKMIRGGVLPKVPRNIPHWFRMTHARLMKEVADKATSSTPAA